ncbi:guanine nucleotide binding protein, alpha subunit [Hanseniaspora valbyensis NRRL Y-1626]|uniref:Guanine nucleotide-binding protein alpha-1 subunit n=1 Tax=Hanseniaspora valbyensis NRRL Y-1626 TaxID=766949 RepID=A0A1B7TGA1_9ASCO|nr:guanine nucleotide binding protein, alpha subunit [Hanseniaspora valbyensis NRRL Y-1626]
MGCTVSSPDNQQLNNDSLSNGEADPFLNSKKANDIIDQQLMMNYKKERTQIKLLLLGTGESGKSTVLKQLQLLHHGGFSHKERTQYTQVIWADAIQSMKILIVQARRLGIELQCDDPIKYPQLFQCKKTVLNAKALDMIDAQKAGGSDFMNEYVLKYSERSEKKRQNKSTGKIHSFIAEDKTEAISEAEKEEDDADDDDEEDNDDNTFGDSKHETSSSGLGRNTMDENTYQQKRTVLANAIKTLWEQDLGIQQCFDRSNEFQLEGSAEYYFENIKNFSRIDYLASDVDILKGRIKTSGITETNFQINSREFKVLDAGGQRSERRKWIHCFEGITCVLFVVAVSEYDQMLFEDEKVNRMHESLLLFDRLCNSQWFSNTPFIIFFNKIDIFQEKIGKSPIRKYFPEYQGGSNDVNQGIKYFESLFASINRTNRPVYMHRTCATDTKSMKFILNAVTDLIIQQNLKKSGLF